MPGDHSVTFTTSTAMAYNGLFAWVGRCSCGDNSERAGEPDGTLDAAKRWRDQHLREVREALPGGALARPLDEPDDTPDTYDAFLRGLTTGGNP